MRASLPAVAVVAAAAVLLHPAAARAAVSVLGGGLAHVCSTAALAEIGRAHV